MNHPERMLRRGRRAVVRAGLAALLAAGLAGCGIPGTLTESPRLYTLTPVEEFEEELPQADWQLLIEAPTTAAGLDTTRIALSESPTTLDYFANVAWTDRAPLMVQTLLVESFENSERIVSVGRENIGLRSDYLLKAELRDFQAEYPPGNSDAPPRVHVRINAKLVEMPRRDIVANRTFESVVPAQGDTVQDIVAAWNEALREVLRDVVGWTLAQGDVATS